MKVTLDFDNETMEFDRDVSVKDLKQFVKEHQLQGWSVKGSMPHIAYFPSAPYVQPHLIPTEPYYFTTNETTNRGQN